MLLHPDDPTDGPFLDNLRSTNHQLLIAFKNNAAQCRVTDIQHRLRDGQDYARTGHRANIALKSLEHSDYQVGILEVAGTSAATDDIIAMEERWKKNLQSKEMGLNR